MSLQTQLSYLMPVATAVSVLGEERVTRCVTALLRLQLLNSAPTKNNANNDVPDETIDEDASTLVHSMMYTTNAASPASHGNSASGSPHHAVSGIPPPILQAWKRLMTRPLLLDKLTLTKFLIPASAQPHNGPGGHMGLFDCLTYVLQTKPGLSPSGSAPPPGSPTASAAAAAHPATNFIAIPDVIIFLAVCHNYWLLQSDSGDEDAIASFSSEHPTIITMSQLMFLLYDAYQKKGFLVRDTMHRFLSDVHGEDSFKTPSMREMLDKLFQKSSQLTSQSFVQAITDTLVHTPQPSHVLLDWMASLAHAIQPHAVPNNESTQVFLKTVDQQAHRLPKLCADYHLAEHRLYEIKRRFHSLVETTTSVIQGDPMSSDQPTTTDNSKTTANNAQSTANNLNAQVPKHVIPIAAFLQAVCNGNDEQGHGGYLPTSLAKSVFQAVVRTADPPQEDISSTYALFGNSNGADATTENSNNADDSNVDSSTTTNNNNNNNNNNMFWDLTHVLQFGGLCVRAQDNDESLIQWIVQRLLLPTPRTTSSNGDTSTKGLDSKQLAQLLKMLCEHKEFRLVADKAVTEDAERENDNSDPVGDDRVSCRAALALGLLPKAYQASKSVVPVQVLVDEIKKSLGGDVEENDIVTKEQLLSWHRAVKGDKSQERLGCFITELRLIASVLFGVPPKLASLERQLVSEIQRRHKSRYPQTSVSRRGPRGTVWYLIDDAWFRGWTNVVENISFTPEDGKDLRDHDNASSSPRRIGKISNRGMLRDGGSLALRNDVKWRHDYEILPPLAWSALQAWYDGGPPIHRLVVPYTLSHGAGGHNRPTRGSLPTENEIELYPFFVTMFLCDAPSRGEARPFQQGVPLSRVSPVRVLLVQLCKELDVDPNLGRLWVMDSSVNEEQPPSKRSGDWLLDLDANIVEQRKNRIDSEHAGSTINLLLELKDEETGLWPRGEDGKTWTFSKADEKTIDTGDGIVGLYNMGNTCYLNSSIQCLSHTPIFRDYFTSKCYLKDINTTNPLGHQGHLAQVSAVLINSLWKRFNQQMTHQPKRVTAPGSYAPVNAPALTPKTFKESIGKFNDHFAGNEQHDAQELLAFLLGGLSEDLNRIVEKPYIQAPDSDGRPDSELADIWWSNHLKREMSIIVALFTGQYKSLLKCKTCGYESARFEPFSFLQVPLPEDDTIPVNLILYPTRPGTDTMKYSVRVHNNGTLYDVLVSLSKVLYADEQDAKGETNSGVAPTGDDSGPEAEAEKERLKALYHERSMNMAVVDMREGYIFKIAPNVWRLPDLQNKDTGELPLLHVYELDPMKKLEKAENSEEKEGSTEEEDLEEQMRSRCSFLALAQRRTELLAKEVLHPLSHRVFGTPLLLRLTDMDKMTGSEIYDVVAHHLKNFVPSSALKFLHNDSSSNGKSSEETSGDTEEKKSKYEVRQHLPKTLTDMEEVAAGRVPRYGFRLRITARDGRRCALCPWYDCCIGCLVPDDHNETAVMNGDSLAIDWHVAVDLATNGFGLRSSQGDNLGQPMRGRTAGVTIKNHSTCAIGKQNGHAGAITLEDCLDAFAQEEKIPEAYCSKCKDFRVQTKRMSLWRLPPVVIIHLKRFQFTQHMRRKLRDFVHFPIEGLDLSRIMAADTVGTPSSQEGNANKNVSTSKGENTENGKNSPPASPGTNGDQARLNEDDGRSEILYDLYGVVHHQGALSGGHYVASLKSETDGQWRLFNDAQIYEIHSRDVVDSSAYILFYIRRDVKNLKLDDFWNTSPAKEGEGLTEEEMDKLIQGRSDRCVVS